jgi:hypothetical protein
VLGQASEALRFEHFVEALIGELRVGDGEFSEFVCPLRSFRSRFRVDDRLEPLIGFGVHAADEE